MIQSDGTRCATAQPRSLAHVSRKFIFSRVPFGSRRQVLSSDSRSCSGLFPDLQDRQRTTRTQPRCASLRASPPRPLGPLITHTVPAGSTRYTPPFDSYFCSGRSRPRGGGPAALRAGWRPRAARKPPLASAYASWGALRACARRGGGHTTAGYRGRARVRGSGREERVACVERVYVYGYYE